MARDSSRNNSGRTDYRGDRGGRQRFGGRGNNSHGRGGKFNKKFKKRNQDQSNGFLKDDKVVIKYKKPKIKEDDMEVKFYVYDKKHETTYTLQSFEGNSDEELSSAVIKYWDMVEEYNMLPTDENSPEIAPARLRQSTAGVIGVVYAPLPRTQRERIAELEKRKAHEHTKRKAAFRAAKNMLKMTESQNAFGNAMRDLKE